MEVVFRRDHPANGYLADLLDDLALLDASMEGAFYPISLGHQRKGFQYPNMWGWVVAPAQRDAFETLFMTGKDAEAEKTFPGCFYHCEWLDPSTYEVSLVPAPVHADQPLPGHAGESAAWARFSSYGWMSRQFSLHCDFVSGRCRANIRNDEDLPEVTFKIAPGKLRTLATLGAAELYHEPCDPWSIYDGDRWDYALGTESAVLLRGSRRYDGEKGGDPMRQLFYKIRRSGLAEMRSSWGFTL